VSIIVDSIISLYPGKAQLRNRDLSDRSVISGGGNLFQFNKKIFHVKSKIFLEKLKYNFTVPNILREKMLFLITIKIQKLIRRVNSNWVTNVVRKMFFVAGNQGFSV